MICYTCHLCLFLEISCYRYLCNLRN